MKPNLRQLSKARLDFIKPMLAKPAAQLPAGSNWLYELKLDGYRTLALKQRNVVTLFSRRGNIMNLHFPTIATACSFLPNDTIVDGEVVVLDHSGKPSFSALQHSRFTPDALYFYIFDLLAYEGKDVRKLPLTARRRLLEDYALKGMRDPVRLSAVFTSSPNALIAATRKAGLEGVIAKRRLQARLKRFRLPARRLLRRKKLDLHREDPQRFHARVAARDRGEVRSTENITMPVCESSRAGKCAPR
jgi:bifunctional non-homologous end joining protein LigD